MKTIICMVLLLISPIAFASEPQPKYLKDATITVTLKDGKQYTFSENDFKVVPRVQKEETPVLTPAPMAKESDTPTQKEAVEHNSEISVYAGYGATGLNSSTVNNTTTIDQKNGAVFGVGYSHKVKGPVNAKAIMFNNNSYFGGLGLEF